VRTAQKKDETRRVRFTVGGDQVDYPGAVSTKTADFAKAPKILIVLPGVEKKYPQAPMKFLGNC
jgi:hypothetical protein